MSKLETTLQNLPLLIKYLLVLAAVIFISTLFPAQNRFPYKFEKGENWDYENLYAPKKFYVYKSAEELAKEKNEIEKKLSAVYIFNTDKISDRKNSFKGAFDKKIAVSGSTYPDVSQNSKKYFDVGNEVIDRIFDTGVLELNTEHKIQNIGSEIFIFKGLSLDKRKIVSFFIPKTASTEAIDFIFQKRLTEGDFLVSLFEESFFVPNVYYQDSISKQIQDQQFAKIQVPKDSIFKDQLIIASGDEILDHQFEQLQSLEQHYGSNGDLGGYSWSTFLGYFLLTSLVIGVFLFYLQFHAVEIFKKYSWLIFILVWVVLYCYITYVVERSESLNAFMIPFCIAPIVLKSFFDVRVALFTHIVIVLLASILSSEGYEFTFLQLLAGIVAVLTPIQTRDWTKFFYFLATIFGTYVLGFFGLSLIDNTPMIWSTYGWIFWSVFLTLLAYPLIPLSERIFGFTSPISLVELSDINKPLLKKLSEKAPGTFQHSLQVGNLAEAAANKIDADALLVKVAALYHDIGKIEQPNFFIENQEGKNPHDDLDPLESAKIILKHVEEGEKMAKKNRLPESIINFIKSHHGTTRVEYFYKKYKDLNPTQKIDDKDFTYAGPLPKTKEETILLLADSIEAAAKSLKKKTEETLSDLVNDIIYYKISKGQLVESELTFEELEICRTEFVKTLKNINHGRIEYDKE